MSSWSSLAGLGLEQNYNFVNPFAGIFWNHLESFGIFWVLWVSFGLFWNLLDSSAVSASCLCRHFPQLNPLNTLESFRAAFSSWDSSSSELRSSCLVFLGAYGLQSISSLVLFWEVKLKTLVLQWISRTQFQESSALPSSFKRIRNPKTSKKQ